MRKNLLIYLLALIHGILSAQSSYVPQIYPSSPEAVQLYKFEKIAVSEYTGTPNISIPLYSISEGNTELPLMLNYAGGGIKIEEEATKVGLGWSLALPTITQVMRGLNDLRNPSGINLTKDIDGYNKIIRPYYLVEDDPWVWPKSFPNKDYNATPVSPQITASSYLSGSWFPMKGLGMQYVDASLFGVDFEEDIFKLNLFGKIINFKRDVTKSFGNFISTNEYNYTFKIVYDKNITNIADRPISWIITDPKGIKYYFETSTKTNIDNWETKRLPEVWYITKIVDVNNNTININYETLTFTSFPKSSSSNIPKNYFGKKSETSQGHAGVYIPNLSTWSNTRMVDLRLDNLGSPNYVSIFGNITSYSGNGGLFSSEDDLTGKTANNTALETSITTSKEKLIYYSSFREDIANAKRVDSIQIRTLADKRVKSIKFNYGYFTANEPNPSSDQLVNKKLKLNSVCINDQCTSFNYYDQYLPKKDSKANDYWGYYNGNHANTSRYPEALKFVGNSSDPQFDALMQTDDNHGSRGEFAQAASIKEIIYPTKGRSTFEYELNEFEHINQIVPNYDAVQNTIAKGWGIRVRNIIYKDENAGQTTTNYQYTGGKAIKKLKIVENTGGVSHKYLHANYNQGSTVWTIRQEGIGGWIKAYLNNQYAPNIFDDNSDIGYDKVTKIEKDKDGDQKGSVISEFTNTPETNFGTHVIYKDPAIPGVLDKKKNGLLTFQYITDQQNNTIKKIKNNYDYSYKLPIDYGFKVVYDEVYAQCPPSPSADCTTVGPFFYMVYYPQVFNQANLSGTVETDYINGKELVTATTNTYNSNNQLTLKVSTFPDGTTKASSVKFAEDLGITKLKDANMVDIPITVTKDSQDPYITKTNYDNPNSLNPTSVESAGFVMNGVPTMRTEIIYDQYDTTKGNLKQYTDSKSGIPTAVIWGYNNSLPIAKIVGATYPDPNNPKPDTDIPQASIDNIVNASNTDASALTNNDESVFLTALNTFRNDAFISKFQVTTYTYDPLVGVRSITYPGGITESYKYDKATRLEKILDKDSNIIKEFKYNYAPTKYYNDAQSRVIVRNNCPSGQIGGNYTYTVPAGRYFSYENIGIANQLAITEINNQGQAAANTYGTCTGLSCGITKATYFNQYVSGTISSNISVINVVLNIKTDTSIYNWRNWVNVAKISGNCVPYTERLSSCYANGNWNIKIDISGNVYVQKVNGTLTNLESVNLNFNYQSN